jgi:microcystin-dependent protein
MGFHSFIGEIRWVGFDFAPRSFKSANIQRSARSGRDWAGHGSGAGHAELGDAGGDEAVTLAVNQMPAHSHPAMASSNTASSDAPGGRVLANATADGRDPKIYSSGQGNAAGDLSVQAVAASFYAELFPGDRCRGRPRAEISAAVGPVGPSVSSRVLRIISSLSSRSRPCSVSRVPRAAPRPGRDTVSGVPSTASACRRYPQAWR